MVGAFGWWPGLRVLPKARLAPQDRGSFGNRQKEVADGTPGLREYPKTRPPVFASTSDPANGRGPALNSRMVGAFGWWPGLRVLPKARLAPQDRGSFGNRQKEVADGTPGLREYPKTRPPVFASTSDPANGRGPALNSRMVGAFGWWPGLRVLPKARLASQDRGSFGNRQKEVADGTPGLREYPKTRPPVFASTSDPANGKGPALNSRMVGAFGWWPGLRVLPKARLAPQDRGSFGNRQKDVADCRPGLREYPKTRPPVFASTSDPANGRGPALNSRMVGAFGWWPGLRVLPKARLAPQDRGSFGNRQKEVADGTPGLREYPKTRPPVFASTSDPANGRGPALNSRMAALTIHPDV